MPTFLGANKRDDESKIGQIRNQDAVFASLKGAAVTENAGQV